MFIYNTCTCEHIAINIYIIYCISYMYVYLHVQVYMFTCRMYTVCGILICYSIDMYMPYIIHAYYNIYIYIYITYCIFTICNIYIYIYREI